MEEVAIATTCFIGNEFVEGGRRRSACSTAAGETEGVTGGEEEEEEEEERIDGKSSPSLVKKNAG